MIKKTIFFILAITILLVFTCTIEHGNILDEKGNSYVLPSFGVDSSKSSISRDDTIHFDTATLVLLGNDVQTRFKINSTVLH